jgi:hypothetical protein
MDLHPALKTIQFFENRIQKKPEILNPGLCSQSNKTILSLLF